MTGLALFGVASRRSSIFISQICGASWEIYGCRAQRSDCVRSCGHAAPLADSQTKLCHSLGHGRPKFRGETLVKVKLPETDLKTVQNIDSIELKDGAGRHIGQYFFGKSYGRTVLLFGKYKGTFKTHDECQAFVDGVLAVINS